MKPTFSVVVPCYNEEKYLGLLLDDLVAQTEKPFEVIVADSDSTDKTVAEAKTYAKKLPLQIANTKTRTPGGARNAGARVATGEYLIFIDADSRLDPDFISKMRTATKEGGIDFVSPLYRPEGNSLYERFTAYGINRHTLKETTHRRVTGIGGVMCLRKSFHDKLGGFDEHMAKEEDMEYLERLLLLKPSVAIATDVKVMLSDRRYKKEGSFISFLNLIPRNSFVGKRITYPLMRKFGHKREYGNF